jgi:hypothetical protein
MECEDWDWKNSASRKERRGVEMIMAMQGRTQNSSLGEGLTLRLYTNYIWF